MGMELQGKTAVITGSSCGVGRAIAIEFARQGAKVVCCARREERLRETAVPEEHAVNSHQSQRKENLF